MAQWGEGEHGQPLPMMSLPPSEFPGGSPSALPALPPMQPPSHYSPYPSFGMGMGRGPVLPPPPFAYAGSMRAAPDHGMPFGGGGMFGDAPRPGSGGGGGGGGGGESPEQLLTSAHLRAGDGRRGGGGGRGGGYPTSVPAFDGSGGYGDPGGGDASYPGMRAGPPGSMGGPGSLGGHAGVGGHAALPPIAPMRSMSAGGGPGLGPPPRAPMRMVHAAADQRYPGAQRPAPAAPSPFAADGAYLPALSSPDVCMPHTKEPLVARVLEQCLYHPERFSSAVSAFIDSTHDFLATNFLLPRPPMRHAVPIKRRPPTPPSERRTAKSKRVAKKGQQSERERKAQRAAAARKRRARIKEEAAAAAAAAEAGGGMRKVSVLKTRVRSEKSDEESSRLSSKALAPKGVSSKRDKDGKRSKRRKDKKAKPSLYVPRHQRKLFALSNGSAPSEKLEHQSTIVLQAILSMLWKGRLKEEDKQRELEAKAEEEEQGRILAQVEAASKAAEEATGAGKARTSKHGEQQEAAEEVRAQSESGLEDDAGDDTEVEEEREDAEVDAVECADGRATDECDRGDTAVDDAMEVESEGHEASR